MMKAHPSSQVTPKRLKMRTRATCLVLFIALAGASCGWNFDEGSFVSLAPVELLVLGVLTVPIIFAFVPQSWLSEDWSKWGTVALLVGFSFLAVMFLIGWLEMLQANCNEGLDERACEIRAWWRGTEH